MLQGPDHVAVTVGHYPGNLYGVRPVRGIVTYKGNREAPRLTRVE